ncbi:proteasome subunit alpha type-6 [Tanacetum coccineum]
MVHCLLFFIPAYARTLVQQARNEAIEFRFKYGYEMPVDALARWIPNKSQDYTQHAYMRPLGVVQLVLLKFSQLSMLHKISYISTTVAMVLGIDDENGPKLFKCDPAGHFFGDDDHWLESGNHFFDKWTSTRLMLIEEKQVTIRAIKSWDERIYS